MALVVHFRGICRTGTHHVNIRKRVIGKVAGIIKEIVPRGCCTALCHRDRTQRSSSGSVGSSPFEASTHHPSIDPSEGRAFSNVGCQKQLLLKALDALNDGAW
jgi:hypothetical protein